MVVWLFDVVFCFFFVVVICGSFGFGFVIIGFIYVGLLDFVEELVEVIVEVKFEYCIGEDVLDVV